MTRTPGLWFYVAALLLLGCGSASPELTSDQEAVQKDTTTSGDATTVVLGEVGVTIDPGRVITPVQSMKSWPAVGPAATAPTSAIWVELTIVHDYARWSSMNSAALEDAEDVVLKANTIIANLKVTPPVRLVVVEHITFPNGNPFLIPIYEESWTNSSALLELLEGWLNGVQTVRGDAVVLFSGIEFEAGVGGRAYLGTICHSFGTSVVSTVGRRSDDLAMTLVHEVAHTLGIGHDEPSAGCAEKGFVMAGVPSLRSKSWSECSRTQLQSFLDDRHGKTTPACLQPLSVD